MINEFTKMVETGKIKQRWTRDEATKGWNRPSSSKEQQNDWNGSREWPDLSKETKNQNMDCNGSWDWQ